MTKINKLQSSFSKGEISPRLLGRADTDFYGTSLQTCENYIPSYFGGLIKRPGLKYVAPLRTQSVTGKLMPFRYSNITAYMLEFTNLRLRFYKTQGLLLQSRTISNGTFDSDISGWSSISSGSGAISFSSGKLALTSSGGGNEARAVTGPIANYGIGTTTVTVDVGTNSVVYKVGTTSGASDIATNTLTAGTGKTFTFTPTSNGNIYLTFQSTANATIDNVVLSNAVYEIDTPYTTADLDDLRGDAQSFDTLVLTHGSYKPRLLQRLADDNWTLTVADFDEPAYLDENSTDVTLTPSGTTGSITVTASSATFASTDVGRAIRYKAGPENTDKIIYGSSVAPLSGSQTNFNIPFYPQGSGDIEVYIINADGTYTLQTNPANYTVSGGQVVFGSAPAATKYVQIQKKNAGSGEWGWMTITAYTSATQVTATVERTLQGTNASTYWRLGAWSDTTGYPKVSAFHQQRLVFANNTDNPRGVWMSAIGDFYNFSPDNILHKGTVDSDNAFIFSLPINTVNWISSLKSFVIGTNDGVIILDGTISPLSPPEQKRDSSVECAFKDVATTAEEVVFIENLGKRIYSAGFSFENDGYKPDELTLLADHIIGSSKFKQITYADVPGKRIWAITDSGNLLSCTYVKNQQLTGWARHPLTGTDVEVESIAVIPGEDYSELWCLVKRTINGGTKRYVEVMQADFFQMDKEDAFFVDSGLTYTGSPATVISGLDHLEGEEVVINIEGDSHPNRTVSSGSITLDSAASKAHIGLGYSSIAETVGQEGGSVSGTAQSKKSRTHKYNIRVYETLDIKAGFDSDILKSILSKDIDSEIGVGGALYTGWKEVFINSGYNKEYKAYIKQDTPLPSTILSVVFGAGVSDN